MDGEQDGVQGRRTEGQEGIRPARDGGRQEPQEPESQVGGTDSVDFAAQLKAKDAEIEALQAKVAEAAKTAEATEALGKEIADLKAHLADERTEFALRSAGARSVTAAKALLAEHDGDVEALAKAEPWLFEGVGTKGGAEGTTGLEPAGASGGSDAQYMRRWERIAGLADEGKE